jgi:Co/Zn/Cd efflux system component
VPRRPFIQGAGRQRLDDPALRDLVALAANALVAVLLYRYRNDDANRLSVWLRSRNDVIANLAVILAGAGVWASGTPWADIAVAAVIAILGLTSAVRIARTALAELGTGAASQPAIAAR